MNIEGYSLSESGWNHENQDAIALLRHPHDGSAWIFALADGQGGQTGAAEAARIAVQTIISRAQGAAVPALLQAESWMQLAAEADDAVNAAPQAGYCTLVCGFITGEKVTGVSSGDSAAYLLGGKTQTLTQWQSKNPPVGSGGALFTSFGADLEAGQRLLAVTDGVWKFSDMEAITAVASEADLGVLRSHTLSRNGGRLPDDWSAILFTISRD